MQFNNNNVAGYPYHPCAFSPLSEDEPWERDRLARTTPAHRTSSVPAMHRYLEEMDHPLFTAEKMHDDVTMHPFPSLEFEPSIYPHPATYAYILPRHIPSPSNSGPSSSHISSDWSDRRSTPWSSPDPTCSPRIAYDNLSYNYGGNHSFEDIERSISGPCVTLHEVQCYADTQPEKAAFDDGSEVYYASYAQEGYQPMQPNAEPSNNGLSNASASTYGEERSPELPNLRRRRTQSTQSITSPHLPSKVTKRPARTKRSSSYQTKSPVESNNGSGPCVSIRAFPCPFTVYGCSSTFGTKNEWKRHVNTQHMRLGYWRCDQCDHSERKPNDFNRKDLFIQHVRRMHPIDDVKTVKSKASRPKTAKNDPEEQAMAAIALKCFRCIRSPPEQSGCLFCDAVFKGPCTWDERLEHIGRHMDTTKKENEAPVDPREWQEDPVLQKWLEHEGLIVGNGGDWVLAEGRA